MSRCCASGTLLRPRTETDSDEQSESVSPMTRALRSTVRPAAVAGVLASNRESEDPMPLPKTLTSSPLPLLCLLVPACFGPNDDEPASETEAGNTSGVSGSADTADDSTGGTDHASTGSDESSSSSETGSSGFCGDGALDPSEDCDLGPANSDNASCTSQCKLAECGDGLVELGAEDCDDAGESSRCNADCTAAECGDGTSNMAAGEECDGNVDNSTCDECVLTCDDGFADCGGGPEDGCESFLATDAENCGSCGNSCDGDPCGAGVCNAKVAFLSSRPYFGDFGGVEAADQDCQDLATAAGLPGAFLAWLSVPGNDVIDRFTQHADQYVRTDGARVADDWADLTDGSLDSPINVTEFGTAAEAPEPAVLCHGGETCEIAFTGTLDNGQAYEGTNPNCDGWTSQNFPPSFTGGSVNNVDGNWTLSASGLRCDYAARLYCFEQ